MTFVVTEHCINCKFQDCVEVCPTKCFHVGERMLVIDPDNCIDCSMCEPECASKAIYAEEDLTDDLRPFLELNSLFAKVWPSITEKGDTDPTAQQWIGKPGKRSFISIAEDGARLLAQGCRSPIDLAAFLSHDDVSVRMVAASQDTIPLTQAQVARAISDEHPGVRTAIASNKVIPLSAAQLDTLINDPSSDVRLAAVKSRCDQLVIRQLDVLARDNDPNVAKQVIGAAARLDKNHRDRGLLSPSAEVRAAWVSKQEWALTNDQVDALLRDSSSHVQLTCLKRTDICWTPALLRVAMEAAHGEVRAAALTGHPALVEQGVLQSALADPDCHVRAAALENPRTKLNVEQLEVALLDSDALCRSIALSRRDIRPTTQQIARALDDDDEDVRVAAAARDDVSLSRRTIDLGLRNEHAEVRALFARRLDFTPSSAQVERGLTDSRHVVRRAFFDRADVKLSRYQELRSKTVGFSVETPNSTDDSDPSTDPPNTSCPICRATVTEQKDTWCQHVIAIHVPSERITEGGPGLTKRQGVWLRAQEYDLTETGFSKFCARFKIKRRAIISEDLACGPELSTLIFGFTNTRRNSSRKHQGSAKSRQDWGSKKKGKDADALNRLSGVLNQELVAANGRLMQQVAPRDVLSAMAAVARCREYDCVLLQPGWSGSAWSNRTVPVVFLVRTKRGIRVRIRRARSYRSSGATPAIWKELRGFPHGDIVRKLAAWCAAADGATVEVLRAKKLPRADWTCARNHWKLIESKLVVSSPDR